MPLAKDNLIELPTTIPVRGFFPAARAYERSMMTDKIETGDKAIDHVVLVAAERGGVRKTSTVAALTSFFLARTSSVRVFQIDDQATLPERFGNIVTTIRMPSADVLRNDDLADAMALEPLFLNLFEAPGVAIVDCGANHDPRFFDAAAAIDLDHELCQRQREVTVIVPTTTDPDAVILACRTIERARIVLPSVRIAPMLCEDGGNFRQLGSTAAQRAYDKVIDPLDKTFQARHPRLLPRVLGAVGRTRKSIWDLPDLSVKELTREFREPMILASYIRGDLTEWRAKLDATLVRLFPE